MMCEDNIKNKKKYSNLTKWEKDFILFILNKHTQNCGVYKCTHIYSELYFGCKTKNIDFGSKNKSLCIIFFTNKSLSA